MSETSRSACARGRSWNGSGGLFGWDTLRLVFTQDALTATVCAKLSDYSNWLKTHGDGGSDSDDAYTGFQAFGLSKITSWEKLQVEVVKPLPPMYGRNLSSQ